MMSQNVIAMLRAMVIGVFYSNGISAIQTTVEFGQPTGLRL